MVNLACMRTWRFSGSFKRPSRENERRISVAHFRGSAAFIFTDRAPTKPPATQAMVNAKYFNDEQQPQ